MKKDKLLLVKGAAGLGNRILCLLSAMLYACMTERRLIVDWSDPFYSDDGSNVFHSFFHSPLCTPTDKIPSTESVRPEIWRGRLHESARDMVLRYPSIVKPDSEIWQRLSVDVSKLDYQEELLVMWSYTEQIYLLRKHFNGSYEELSKKSTKTILKELLKESLKLHPSIQESFDEFKRDRFNGKTVGIHIRYSDKKTRLSAIEKKLKTLLRQEPDMQIFLATDNLEICKMFQDAYPRVLSTKKWYPIPGISMHFNHESPNRVDIDRYFLHD